MSFLDSVLDPLNLGLFDAPSTKISSKSTLTPYQQQLIANTGNYLTPFMGKTTAQISPYTSLQNQGFDLASSLAKNIGGYQQTAMDSLNNLISGQWAQPITDWSTRLWSKSIMPSIMNQMSAMDSASSGGTAQALSQGGQDLSLALAAQLAPQMASTQLGATQAMGDVANMPANAINILNALGTQQQTANNPLQSNIWNLLPLLFGQQIENVAIPQSAGLGYSLLAGAGQGAGQGLGAALMAA